MIFGSVCSGIEAASCAWNPLGWRAAFVSEIEPFPRAVLKHRHPDTPLHGDFTTIQAGDYEPIGLLVAGTPCQSFSVAGLRGGLADDRGNLALEYLRLADRLRPRWLVWENVPGVLSSNGGRDFGAILGGMVELGYGFAYRVLDAQFFGVAQRRRRVFVVGYAGDWRRAAAVLFERHSLQGHFAPRREKGENPAPTISSRPAGDGGLGTDFDLDGGLVGKCLLASSERQDPSVETFVVSPSFTSNPYGDNGGREGLLVAFSAKDHASDAGELTPNGGRAGMGADEGMKQRTYIADSAVRRLTPRECERLQGFEDDYTAIPWRGGIAADGPRYKALGNSMAVPCMAWIGRRIDAVESLNFKEGAGS